jgi:hypothetical protein
MDFVDPSVRTVYATLDLIGVVLYGMIGATIARARNFDIVGIVFLAIITALGGGMIRDVLIDNGPPAALQDMRYFGLALLGGVVDGQRVDTPVTGEGPTIPNLVMLTAQTSTTVLRDQELGRAGPELVVGKRINRGGADW